jgi:MFS family permease
MALAAPRELNTGRWLALTAALLGWMFDGFEMGLFPVVHRPALIELLGLDEAPKEVTTRAVGAWYAYITAAFLVGAATGGVLFGWLGDRIGRVRAMSLSILTYALCSGLGGFATAAWHLIVTRFVAALGMGGEWSLGVALVMEVWEGQSRAMLAGVIGAAANMGYLFVAALSLSIGSLHTWFTSMGLQRSWVEWRLLTVCGALPALLVFFVRLWVPESAHWEREKEKGRTTGWQSRDLFSVGASVVVCAGLIVFWINVEATMARLGALVVALILVTVGFLYPIRQYLIRTGEDAGTRRRFLNTMLLGALVCGIPLLATWGSVQPAPGWADQLGKAASPPVTSAKEYAQIASAFGAVLGCVVGAAFAGWAGRRIAYVLLCVTSLASVVWFYQGNTEFGAMFLFSMGLVGFFSAAFYGWIPLYLPELFPTRIRATGQGFAFNFGRILAAVGVLQLPILMGDPPNYPQGCTSLALIYLLGVVAIWFAPETHGRPLPE